MINNKILVLFFAIILTSSAFAAYEVAFQDDFNRPNSPTVGNGWSNQSCVSIDNNTAFTQDIPNCVGASILLRNFVPNIKRVTFDLNTLAGSLSNPRVVGGGFGAVVTLGNGCDAVSTLGVMIPVRIDYNDDYITAYCGAGSTTIYNQVARSGITNIRFEANGAGTDSNYTIDNYKEYIINNKIFIHVRDENSGQDLNGVNLNFNGNNYTLNTSQDFNLSDFTNGANYTMTFTKTGYGTRYYNFDLNVSTDLNIDFLMLPTSKGLDLQYRIFDTNATNFIPNTYVQIYRPDQSNRIIGRLKTDSSGYVTMFTNVFDQNYNELIADTNIYSMVALTVLYPKNEETLVQITEQWRLAVTGAGSSLDQNLSSSKVKYLIPNLVSPYILTASDMNGNYIPRVYTQQFFGNPGTATLQPYLVAVGSGVATTINTIQASTSSNISNVTFKIYRDLPSVGITLIAQVTTDSKGIAQVTLINGDTYIFDMYYNGVLLQSFTILATPNTTLIPPTGFLQFIVDTGTVVTPPTPNGLTARWSPSGTNILSQSAGSTDFNQILNNFSGQNITVYATISQNDVNLDIPKTYTGTAKNLIFNFNVLNSFMLNGEQVIAKMIVKTSDGNVYTFSHTYYVTNAGGLNYDMLKGLREGMRTDMGCSTDAQSLCMPLNILALILSIAVVLYASSVMGQFGTESSAIIFAIMLSFFTYLTWIPLLVTVTVWIIVFAFIFNERRS